MKKQVSHDGAILIATLTLGAVSIAGVVFWYYLQQSRENDIATKQQLHAISDGKTRQLTNWRNERLGDGLVIYSAPINELAVQVLADRPNDPDRQKILRFLNGFVSAFQYAGASLVDLDGHSHLSLGSLSTDTSRLRDAARAAIQAGKPRLSDLVIDRGTGRPVMSLGIPVKTTGAFVLDIDPSRFLYPYLKAWPTNLATGETHLVRRDGDDAVAYLSDLPDVANAPLRFRRLTGNLNLPDEPAYVNGFDFTGPDYRNVPVISNIQRIPDSPWYLVTKIDTREVEAPLRRLGTEVVLIILLIFTANFTGVGLIWRNRQLRNHREREAWFHRIADETPAWLWMSAPDGRVSFLNEPFIAFLGATLDNIADQWDRHFHPDDASRVTELFRNCVANRSEFLDEHRLRRFDGEYRWALGHGRPMFGPGGEYTGHAGSVLDITDRKHAEERIQALTSRTIRAAEEERARLARELHDDTSQQIAALSIATGVLKRKIPPELTEPRIQSDRLQEKLIHLAESVRRMSHQLHPAALVHSGLRTALENYCGDVARLTGLDVSFSCGDEWESCSPETALSLYRIVQEALQNVVKHANARSVGITLSCTAETLVLVVVDDGIGLPPEPLRRNGLGLVSMRERARLVNGTIEIVPMPSGGTKLTVTVPVKPIVVVPDQVPAT